MSMFSLKFQISDLFQRRIPLTFRQLLSVDFFLARMWHDKPNPLETVDLVTFTEEIVKEKLYFLCDVVCNEGH